MRDTLHWLPIRQRIFYLQELCRHVSTLVGRQALRSSSVGKLLVPRVNTSTMQRRAFSVVAPSIYNSLSSQIRLLRLCFTRCLKLIFLTVVGLEAPLSSFLERE